MEWKWFKFEEFACRHCGANLMNHQFIDELDELRSRAGHPLIVSSGYRCPAHNQAVSSTGPHGPHTTGRAVDIRIDRERAYRLLKIAMELNFTGIGVQQKGSIRFMHFDNLQSAIGQPRPTIWSY